MRELGSGCVSFHCFGASRLRVCACLFLLDEYMIEKYFETCTLLFFVMCYESVVINFEGGREGERERKGGRISHEREEGGREERRIIVRKGRLLGWSQRKEGRER